MLKVHFLSARPLVPPARHSPVMGKAIEAEKRDAERELASLPKKQRTAGRIEVAVAQQRILAGKYGKFTPQTNRVAAAAEDMGLSGRSKQTLRELLHVGDPTTRTLEKCFARVDAPENEPRQEPLNAQEPWLGSAPSALVREITNQFWRELSYIHVEPAESAIHPMTEVEHASLQIHLQHNSGNVYTLPFTYTRTSQEFHSMLDRIDQYLTTSVFTDASFEEEPSTSLLCAIAAEPAVAERLRYQLFINKLQDREGTAPSSTSGSRGLVIDFWCYGSSKARQVAQLMTDSGLLCRTLFASNQLPDACGYNSTKWACMLHALGVGRFHQLTLQEASVVLQPEFIAEQNVKLGYGHSTEAVWLGWGGLFGREGLRACMSA